MGSSVNWLLDIPLYLAFGADGEGRVLAGDDSGGSVQLAEIADGVLTTLTALPQPCAGRYRPGHREVIVSHDHDGNERAQLSSLALDRRAELPAGPGDLTPLVRDPRYIHRLADVTASSVCYLTNRRNGVAFDPVIRDLDTGTERALAFGDHSIGEAVISPDGRWLAVTIASPVTANSDHVAVADLSVPPGQERLIPVTEPDAPAMNHELAWTPDSGALVFSSGNGREFTGIARYQLATGQTRWLVTDETADLTGWLAPDGALLLVERNADAVSELALYDAVTGARVRELPLPAAGIVSGPRIPGPAWSPDSRRIVVTLNGADLPGDVLLADLTGAAPAGGAPAGGGLGAPVPVRRLTRTGGRARVDERYRPVRPESHRVPGEDPEPIPVYVYRPAPGTEEGPRAGAAVLVVHGGPEGQARQNFNPVVQALAADGYTVLVPNVRGSAGYGKRWYSADDKRLRLNSVRDLAAIHRYLPELGLDPARAALWGGSYGGYMVLAGLAFQPELWAAGVDLVGIADLVTFLENTSGYRRSYREREYGTLAEDRDFLREASPLTRVADIAAPLLIIHGKNDPRVPLSEAEQIHAALRERGRDCELLVYPDEGHGLARRANRADAYPKAFAFLDRHLGRR